MSLRKKLQPKKDDRARTESAFPGVFEAPSEAPPEPRKRKPLPQPPPRTGSWATPVKIDAEAKVQKSGTPFGFEAPNSSPVLVPDAPPARSGAVPTAPPSGLGAVPTAPPSRSGAVPTAPPKFAVPTTPAKFGAVPTAPPPKGAVPTTPAARGVPETPRRGIELGGPQAKAALAFLPMEAATKRHGGLPPPPPPLPSQRDSQVPSAPPPPLTVPRTPPRAEVKEAPQRFVAVKANSKALAPELKEIRSRSRSPNEKQNGRAHRSRSRKRVRISRETTSKDKGAVVKDSAYWKEKIASMYRTYNPERLSDMDKILGKYVGLEAELYEALCDKYNHKDKDKDESRKSAKDRRKESKSRSRERKSRSRGRKSRSRERPVGHPGPKMMPPGWGMPMPGPGWGPMPGQGMWMPPPGNWGGHGRR